MCGIIGFIGRTGGEPAQDFIMDQYQEQHARGQKGFGLIRATKDSVIVKRAVEPVKALLDISRAPESVLIFHHRMPTSTDNTMDQTHPMFISQDDLTHDYYIVHNGVIRNAQEMFKEHTEVLGYTYRTFKDSPSAYYHKFNDSESFAIELARVIDGKQDTVRTLGSMAYMGLKVDKKTKRPVSAFWGTNGGNTLTWDETPSGLAIASELAYGYESEKTIYYSITFKDIFDKKKNKMHLEDLVDGFDITYASEPPAPAYTPPPAKVYGFSGGYKKDLEPKHLRAGEERDEKDAKDAPDYLNGKDVPSTFTPREWAFRKMGLRSLAKFNDVILDFFDQLALRNAYDPFNESASGDTVDADAELTLDAIGDLLEDAATRAIKVNAYFDMLEQKQDAKTFERMAQEDAPALPAPATTNPLPLHAPTTAQPLSSIDKRAWTDRQPEAW
jgi:predicted glutamine amidotransferase